MWLLQSANATSGVPCWKDILQPAIGIYSCIYDRDTEAAKYHSPCCTALLLFRGCSCMLVLVAISFRLLSQYLEKAE